MIKNKEKFHEIMKQTKIKKITKNKCVIWQSLSLCVGRECWLCKQYVGNTPSLSHVHGLYALCTICVRFD